MGGTFQNITGGWKYMDDGLEDVLKLRLCLNSVWFDPNTYLMHTWKTDYSLELEAP